MSDGAGDRSGRAIHDNSKKLVQRIDDLVVSLDHIAIGVEDLDTAIDWYTRCCRFRVLERRITRGERTGMLSAVLAGGSAVIVLIQGIETDSQVSRFISKFGPGVQHIGLAVNDLYSAIDQVQEGGGVVDTSIIAGDGIRQVFLRRDAGSGVRVELIDRRGGTFSDHSVNQLFQQFESKGLY